VRVWQRQPAKTRRARSSRLLPLFVDEIDITKAQPLKPLRIVKARPVRPIPDSNSNYKGARPTLDAAWDWNDNPERRFLRGAITVEIGFLARRQPAELSNQIIVFACECELFFHGLHNTPLAVSLVLGTDVTVQPVPHYFVAPPLTPLDA
jgi:hypothetical protein